MNPLNPRRNKAFLLDLLIYFALILLPFSMAGVLPPAIGGKATVGGLVVGLLYMIFRDGVGGQSVGKRVFRIQVVRRKTREPIGFGMAFLRGFLTALPVLGWIDFALTTFTANHQRYTDRILGTELIGR